MDIPTDDKNLTNSTLNADYIPEIALAEESYLKRIEHDGQPNREKITTAQIRNTRYFALLETVQYGTFKSESAALLVFKFFFGFREQRRDRYYFASIRVEFEETGDANFTPPVPRNFDNDPQVKDVVPVQVYGNPDPEKRTNTWNLSGSLTASAPLSDSPQAGVNAGVSAQTEATRKRRMNILGERDGDDDHSNFFNAALWTTEENSIQQTGILHNWRAATIITLPKNPKRPIKATMRIEASVAFSLNLARLIPKQDAPILLIADHPKGPQYALGKDFAEADFPWSEVVRIPKEYEDIMHG